MARNASDPMRTDPSPAPPRRVWRDWALVAAVVVSAVPEVLLREDLAWPAVSVAVALFLSLTLLWRRTHPLPAALIAFAAMSVVEVAKFVRPPDDGLPFLWSNGVVLLFPYALWRWASVRHATAGLGVALAFITLSNVVSSTPLGDAIAGYVFFLLSAAIGASVRYRASSQLHVIEEARLLEREQLARELHDSVAHHVSAIVVQAQGGQLVAASDPQRAAGALATIEEAATRALAEMRTMVGALRDGQEADLVPQPGVSDVLRFARDTGDWPRVEVELTGNLDDLDPAIGSAVYRLAQESVTNAMRHARHATHIVVRVVADDGCVRVTIRDDGDAVSSSRNPEGYGLIGMNERAALLGGTLEAGPRPGGGWAVDAVLPRAVSAR